MKIYHYEGTHKFYLDSEEYDVDEEKALMGLEIPAFSTVIKPPEIFEEGKIAVFNGGGWDIVDDNFVRPQIDTLYYDAGRKKETFEYVEFLMEDFVGYPPMSQLCNTVLSIIRICETVKIINKKFKNCINLYESIMSGQAITGIGIYTNQANLPVSPVHEYKMEMESIIFFMRRILDSLVQLTDLLVNFENFKENGKIVADSIGSVFSLPNTNIVKKIILGDETYPKDTTNFLEISNNLFNGLKHTLINDDIYIKMQDRPAFTGLTVKNSDHKNKIIKYHLHDAIHFMMGFQDNVKRVLDNQKLYVNIRDSN